MTKIINEGMANSFFIEAIYHKYKKSRMSMNRFAKSIKVPTPLMSLYFSGKRGVSFDQAVRIGNMLGISLSKIQKMCPKEERVFTPLNNRQLGQPIRNVDFLG